ncbi:GNAT family N-acetyltransferase [Rossellomorea marisflavi]|uniref:GNAT family N-acetyltransferase n=1 Tax=Rossellomorea marisflavi TaxID=189381 RepID=UPI003513E159
MTVSLRPFQPEDASIIKRLAGDKVLADTIGLPHPYELFHAKEWISIHPSLIEAGKEYNFAIVFQSEIAGTIVIRRNNEHNAGELGYWVGREFWGRGHATSAMETILSFGFRDLALNRMWAMVRDSNKGSRNVLEKTGFVEEARLRQARRRGSDFEDCLLYAITRRDYQSIE